MAHSSHNLRAALVALGCASVLSGCGGGGACPSPGVDEEVDGSLVFDGSPSSTDDVALAEAGGEHCSGSLPCVVVSVEDGGTYLVWTCPSAPGAYALIDLGAAVCQTEGAGRVCAPLSGTLTVASVSLPCGDGTCGQLDAELDLAELPTPAPTGPHAAGSAHLSYAVGPADLNCGGSSVPLFGLD